MVKNTIGFISGGVVFLFFLLVPLGLDVQIQRALAVLALCAIWWGT